MKLFLFPSALILLCSLLEMSVQCLCIHSLQWWTLEVGVTLVDFGSGGNACRSLQSHLGQIIFQIGFWSFQIEIGLTPQVSAVVVSFFFLKKLLLEMLILEVLFFIFNF